MSKEKHSVDRIFLILVLVLQVLDVFINHIFLEVIHPVALVTLGVYFLRRGMSPAFHFVLLYLLLFVTARLPYVRYWYMPAGLVVYLIITLSVPPLRRGMSWFSIGRFDRRTVFYLIATVILSSGILVFWYLESSPEANAMVSAIGTRKPLVVVPAVLGFALLNALVEESIYDGVCFHAMEKSFSAPVIVIGLQAVSYSVSHYHGIPSGFIGIGLSFIYGGLMLGFLRYRTGGLLFSVIGHIFADMTIGFLAFYA